MHPPPIPAWLTLMGGDTSRLKATGLEIASKTNRVILAITKHRVIRCSKFLGDRVTETESRGRRDLVAPCYFAARAKMPESGYCYSPVCILSECRTADVAARATKSRFAGGRANSWFCVTSSRGHDSLSELSPQYTRGSPLSETEQPRPHSYCRVPDR